MMKAFCAALWVTVGLAIFASAFMSYMRIQWERSYDNVTLVMDYSEIYKLAEERNYPLEVLFAELKRRGVEALAFSPQELYEVDALKQVQSLGFEPVLILSSAQPALPELSEFHPRMMILSEEQGLVNDKGLPAGSIVGVREFREPQGLKKLYKLGLVNPVRVHMIEADELSKMSVAEALARWERAATERNIRVLYLTFFEQPLEYNLRYLDKLRERLTEKGFRLERLRPAPTFYLDEARELATLLLVLMLTGVVSFCVLAMGRIWKRGLAANLLLWLMAEAFVLVLVYLSSEDLSVLKKLFAFLAAVVAPVSAYLFLEPSLEREPGSLKRGIFCLLGFCIFSLAGGIMIGAILSGQVFFLKLDEFRGVKAAMLLPLLLVFLLYFSRQGLTELRRFSGKGLQNLLLLGSLGAILLLIVLRSENFSIPVLRLEQQIRGFLEDLFYARPRFKEFLLGHPMLLLWGVLGFAKLRQYSIIVLILGMVGQVSIINTFAHLHTPLMLSLLRTVNGIILGLALGLLLLGLSKWGERYVAKGDGHFSRGSKV